MLAIWVKAVCNSIGDTALAWLLMPSSGLVHRLGFLYFLLFSDYALYPGYFCEAIMLG